MRAFLDTNILLDVLLNRAGFFEESDQVIGRCEDTGAEMWIAWHGLATAYYVIQRAVGRANALTELDRIYQWTRVATASDQDARRARGLGFTDFEDALQAVSAESCGADWLVTRNTADFSISSVPAVTPQDFLQRVPAPQP